MSAAAKIILDTSDEAASIKTVTGWVSSNGCFWGDDERMARYDGSTHKVCECGEVAEHRSRCEKCRIAHELAKYAAMPRARWDGVSMLYSDALDEYFMDLETTENHTDDGVTLADLRIIICEPTYAKPIDPNEHYCDDLPEDGDVPASIADAFKALNAAIEACREPLSWFPGKFALDLGSESVDVKS